MTRFTGYLTGIANPHFSGIATTTWRSRKHRTKSRPGRTVTVYCEAGYGVRQLARALTDNGRFTQDSGEIRCRIQIDDLGMLASVQPLDGRE
jgi:rhodanese-related sulfurtransferase